MSSIIENNNEESASTRVQKTDLKRRVEILHENEKRFLDLSLPLDAEFLKSMLKGISEEFNKPNFIISPQCFFFNENFNKNLNKKIDVKYQDLSKFIYDNFKKWAEKSEKNSSFALLLPLIIPVDGDNHATVGKIIFEYDDENKLKIKLNNYDPSGFLEETSIKTKSAMEKIVNNLLEATENSKISEATKKAKILKATKKLKNPLDGTEIIFEDLIKNRLQNKGTKSCMYYVADIIRILSENSEINMSQGYLDTDEAKVELCRKLKKGKDDIDIYIKEDTKQNLKETELNLSNNIKSNKSELNEEILIKINEVKQSVCNNINKETEGIEYENIYNDSGKISKSYPKLIEKELEYIPEEILKPEVGKDEPQCIVNALIQIDENDKNYKYFVIKGNTRPFAANEKVYIKMGIEDSVVDLIFNIRNNGLESYKEKIALGIATVDTKQTEQINLIINGFNDLIKKQNSNGMERTN